MKRYRVTQSYAGCLVRDIIANSQIEAQGKMLAINDITLNEMLDCDWEDPEVNEMAMKEK